MAAVPRRKRQEIINGQYVGTYEWQQLRKRWQLRLPIPCPRCDIDIQPWMRMSSGQKKHPMHKYQHLYFWVLYSLLYILWVLVLVVCIFLVGGISGFASGVGLGDGAFLSPVGGH